MFILYADKNGSAIPIGFQGYQNDVADTLKKITETPFPPFPNNNPNSTSFKYNANDVTFTEHFAMEKANKVSDIHDNLGDGSFELFSDAELQKSVGIIVILDASKISFAYKGIDYYYTEYFSTFNWNSESVLATPYAQCTNITSVDEFLSNILNCERICADNELSFAYSRLRLPFQCVQKTAVEDVIGFSTIGFLRSNFNIDSIPMVSWINYASLYTAMKGHPLFQVDMMTIAGERFRPAVLYSVSMIESHGKVAYDKITLTTVEDNSAGIDVGLNDATLSVEIENVKSDMPVKRFLTDKIQLPSMTFSLYELINKGVNVKNTLSKTSSIPRLIMANEDTKDAILSMPVDAFTRYGSMFPKQVVFTQTIPFSNLSASAKSAGDINFSTVRLETDDPEEELYIPHIACLIGAYANDVNDSLVNLDYKDLSCVTYPATSSITGNDVLKFFYDDKVEEWIPPEPIDPDIPNDTGNGGFNDNPDGGGGGSWSDDNVNTGVGDDPSRDPIYTMPDEIGISGNYEIVKLTNAGMKSLAEQSWTPDGWIANCMKLQGMTRLGDGILSVKTCFAEIPSTTNANIVAVAGQSLPKPIPCTRIQQYNQWKFEPIAIPKYFGSFLDYAPYTQIVVELPFGQPATIPPELVVGKSIHITLRCDVMSESAMYIITNGNQLIAQVPADIFIHIPFGSSEYTQSGQMGMVNMIGQLGKVGTNIATGGLSNAVSNLAAAPYDTGAGGVTPQSVVSSEGLTAVGKLASAATSMMNQTHNMQDNRNITQIDNGGGPGAIGAMGTKTPVVKISRPYVPIPKRYYDLNGCPSGYIRKVGDCKGYLEVGAIYGAIKCNTEEFAMITEVLGAGVFP